MVGGRLVVVGNPVETSDVAMLVWCCFELCFLRLAKCNDRLWPCVFSARCMLSSSPENRGPRKKWVGQIPVLR